MKIRKLLMVEPKAPCKHFFSIVRLPRLGLPILGTLASRRGIDVRVVIEEAGELSFDQVVAADLLCISTITSTAPGAYRLADRARAAGTPVVIGGPHATFLPDEALAHADWVMRGETEHVFGQFLDMLEQHTDPVQVPGLSYRRDGQTVHNPKKSEAVDLDRVPIPDFSLLAKQGKKGFDFDRGVIPIQTSRGCPHECSFCSVTPMFGRKLRFASNEHVAEELERRRGHGNGVFFYDDNFCGSPARAKSLLDHLLTKNIFLPPWLAQVSVRAAKDLEMLKLMKRSGCRTVFVGLESINPEALSQYHKRQTLDDIRLAIRRFKEHGIWVHGMFVLGADSDGLDSIQATRRFAEEEDIETIQFSVLTPLPGSQLMKELDSQGRLISRDWSLYDVQHAVFQPARMSAYQLTHETMKSMARYYSISRIIKIALRGKIMKFVFNFYARRQIKRWQKEHRRRGQTPALDT
ncbi:MAG: B12-binding domain-containing radical SAM protein [Deltaproteobacteria bacterium]|nr:B12-binding domain-containing radical SAM protein [Deltaproteobacteria bacterium]MBW1871063.1 B12-binding domain-containing radical SAM protein [Deltaproteobacteria bacterium]